MLSSQGISLKFSSEYRLVTNERRDGVGATQGRLEGRLNSTAPWQPMCSYGWYNEQSQVACRMLGFKNGSAVSNYLFPMNESLLHPSTININFRCKGNESALEDCEGDWTPYCGRGSSVAVICNGDNTDRRFQDVCSQTRTQTQIQTQKILTLINIDDLL